MAHERDFGAVLDGAKAGAPWAVAVLFEELQPRLLRYLRSRDRDAAEDLAAEVWEAIARGIRSFEGDEAGFRGWAFTIARRRLIDARRRTGRRQTDVSDADGFASLPAVDVTDVEAIERLSAQDAVTLITATLSEEQAEVVLLRVVAGIDTAVVAEVMQRTETWVRVTQHRALKKLAESLGPKISAGM
ncbi:MAG TPA: RNA polymerase sigma factor [Acidimicrobiales bacterium]|nr:RNA polymerase sigma factor [Acidimicrobiales bacterium]